MNKLPFDIEAIDINHVRIDWEECSPWVGSSDIFNHKKLKVFENFAKRYMKNSSLTKVEHHPYGKIPSPSYNVEGDYIRTYERKYFKNSLYYYDILLHEITHSTGASHRLNREFGTYRIWSKVMKAEEEYIAEIVSWLLMAHLNPNQYNEDEYSLMYLKSQAELCKTVPSTLVNNVKSRVENVFEYIIKMVG